MVRLRKVAGALGILLVAIFGTIGLLTGTDDPGGRASLVVAVVGAVLWIQGLALGDHRKVRIALGAVGLVTVAVLGPISLLVFAYDPAGLPALLPWLAIGLVLWCQAISAQTGLGLRITATLMTVIVGLALLIGAAAAVAAVVVVAVLGPVAGGASGPFVRGILLVAATAFVTSWSIRHPRGSAILRAIGRASMARATPDDVRILAALAPVRRDPDPGTMASPE